MTRNPSTVLPLVLASMLAPGAASAAEPAATPPSASEPSAPVEPAETSAPSDVPTADPGTGAETSAASEPSPSGAPDAAPAGPPGTSSDALSATATAPAGPAVAPSAAAAPAGSPAAASAPNAEKPASLAPFTFGTSTWSRFEVREGYDRLNVSPPAIQNPARNRFSEGDLVAFRARIAMTSQSLPLGAGLEGQIQISPQASGTWGTSGQGGTVGEANLGIYEGYFTLAGGASRLQVGRFAMDYGDAIVIGSLGWNQAGQAFDGARLRQGMGRGNVDLFVTQVASGFGMSTDPFLAGDGYFWGAYASLGGFVRSGFDLDVYFLGLSAASAETYAGVDSMTGDAFSYQRDGATLFTLGVRHLQKLGIFDYRLEAGAQAGESATSSTDATDVVAEARTTRAFQVDGEVGLSPVPQLRLSLGANYASGDDPSTPENEGYNHLYPTGHKWLGWTDVIGARTNVTSGFFKVTAGLSSGLSAELDLHLFVRPELGGLGEAAAASSQLAGGEVNAQLLQKLGKFASVRGMYGIFIPNRDHYGTPDPAHYFELQAGIEL